MNWLRSIAGIAVLLTLGAAASPQTIPDNVGKSSAGLPPALLNVGFEPPLNGQLPLDLGFRDEAGREVRLRDYFGQQKPVLLALVYYGCPMLCNQVEQGVVGSLKMLSFNAGRDFRRCLRQLRSPRNAGHGRQEKRFGHVALRTA